MDRGRPRGEERGQVIREEVADALDRQVGRRIGGERLRIVRAVALPQEDGGDPAFPTALNGAQVLLAVVVRDVMVGRINTQNHATNITLVVKRNVGPVLKPFESTGT